MTARLRPRFRLRVSIEADEVMQVFARRIEREELPCVVQLYEHQVEVSIRESDRHFWSPFLNLIVEQRGGGVSSLSGKYGPNINVWTMFLAAYAVLFIAGTAGFFIGTSQMQIEQPVTGFYLTAGCVIGAMLFYGVGLLGRRLAHPQMEIIHSFLQETFAGQLLELRDEEMAGDGH